MARSASVVQTSMLAFLLIAATAAPLRDAPFTLEGTLTNDAHVSEAFGTKTNRFAFTSDGAVAWLVGDWSYDTELQRLEPGEKGLQGPDFFLGDLLVWRPTWTAIRYDLVQGVAHRCDADVAYSVAADGTVRSEPPVMDLMELDVRHETFWSFVWRGLDRALDGDRFVRRSGWLLGTPLPEAGDAGLPVTATRYTPLFDPAIALRAEEAFLRCGPEEIW
mgnify:CR=1 FL=1